MRVAEQLRVNLAEHANSRDETPVIMPPARITLRVSFHDLEQDGVLRADNKVGITCCMKRVHIFCCTWRCDRFAQFRVAARTGGALPSFVAVVKPQLRIHGRQKRQRKNHSLDCNQYFRKTTEWLIYLPQ